MHKRILVCCVALSIGLIPLLAASPDTDIVVTLNGALSTDGGGTDCLSENNATVTAAITFSSNANPTHVSVGGTLVTYRLAPGTVTINFSGGDIPNFTNKRGWKAVFSTKAQALELSGAGPGEALWLHTKLQKGSWSDAILQHPTAFSPSPQDLKPGTDFMYNKNSHNCVAQLAFTGTASN